MHAICEEMETRWPAELAGVRLQHFTVSYSPCLDCMRAEWRLPQAVRCHCNQEALEEVTFYTSPSLTFSKIGQKHKSYVNKHFEPVLVCCGFFLTVR